MLSSRVTRFQFGPERCFRKAEYKREKIELKRGNTKRETDPKRGGG